MAWYLVKHRNNFMFYVLIDFLSILFSVVQEYSLY
jgi:hypothetical protein